MRELYKKSILLFFALGSLVLIDLVFGKFVIPQFNKFRSAHYFYHHGLLPHHKDISRWGGAEYMVYTNSLGMKDGAAREVQLKPSSKRIIFIGDSFTEGIGMRYENSFVGLVGDRIHAEVLNSGVVGYSPKLYYLRTKYLIEEVGLKFDEALIFIDISDVLNEIEYEDYAPGQIDPANGTAYRIDSILSSRSALYYLLSSKVKSRKAMEQREILAGFTPCWGVEHPEIYNSRVEAAWTLDKNVYERFGKKGLLLAKQNMTSLIELLKMYNVMPYIVVYPWPAQIYAYDKDSLQVRFWRDFSANNKVPFLDLFPEFIDEKRFTGPDEVYSRFFIQGDIHWNSAGHNMVANKILQFLEGNKSASFEGPLGNE